VRRCVLGSAALAACFLLILPLTAAAQQSIIIVCHAERQAGNGDDPLSEAGRHRAERLAAMLKDAGITHIFVSNRRGTLETAQPLARLHNVSATPVPIPTAPRGKVNPSELQVRATIAAMVRLPPTAVVLVVGHGDTVPIFLRRLGYPTAITIPDNEFDNVFIVTPRASRPPAVVRLRF
jgi:broad specificity phosphatase PhoE